MGGFYTVMLLYIGHSGRTVPINQKLQLQAHATNVRVLCLTFMNCLTASSIHCPGVIQPYKCMMKCFTASDPVYIVLLHGSKLHL